MNSHSLHQQISFRLEQLIELHKRMSHASTVIPQVEIDEFLHQVKQLYEAALLLNHQNAIRSLDELETTVAEIFQSVPKSTPKPDSISAPAVHKPENSSPSITEKVPAENLHQEKNEIAVKPSVPSAPLTEAAVKQQAVKNEATVSKTKNGNSDLHELFEDQPTLAGQYKDQETLGERISSKNPTKRVAEGIKKKPVHDLKEAIGINEKFQFINKLFEGDTKTYHHAIDYLNACGDVTSAKEYVKTTLVPRYNWTLENAPADFFMELVERRFLV